MLAIYVSAALFGVVSAGTFAPPAGSGVIVSIENGAKGLNVGGGDRAIFELDERYVPLSRAAKAVGDLDALRLRLAGVKNVARDQAPNAIIDLDDEERKEISDDAAEFPTPLKLVDGEWQEWSKWSGCVNGARTRIRACVARRPAWRVSCEGDAKETIACFDTAQKTAVAEDPWTIEREILGRNMKEN